MFCDLKMRLKSFNYKSSKICLFQFAQITSSCKRKKMFCFHFYLQFKCAQFSKATHLVSKKRKSVTRENPLSDHFCATSFTYDTLYEFQVSLEESLSGVLDTSCISNLKLEQRENHNWQAVKGSKTLHSARACQAKHGLFGCGGNGSACETLFTVYSGMTAAP